MRLRSETAADPRVLLLVGVLGLEGGDALASFRDAASRSTSFSSEELASEYAGEARRGVASGLVTAESFGVDARASVCGIGSDFFSWDMSLAAFRGEAADSERDRERGGGTTPPLALVVSVEAGGETDSLARGRRRSREREIDGEWERARGLESDRERERERVREG